MTNSADSPCLAILPDFAEEGWPSMDLAAEVLLARPDLAAPLAPVRVCPAFRRRLTRLPWLGRRRFALNADRLLNRHVGYPRFLRRRRSGFAAFHVCDHSYGQLALELPAGRTGVFCHDLDAFRCLLTPEKEPRPAWFRALARRTLRGLQRAAIVFHTTLDVREQIVRHGLIDPTRLVQAPLGVSAEYTAEAPDEVKALPAEAAAALGGRPFLLHVGSCIPRKRIDVLIDVFAELRARRPDLHLVKVGGPWAPAQREQIDRRGVGGAITQLTNLSRPAVAALYRRAAVVLVPSDAEGFGLPVIEALACGACVLASDLPVLREVGGDAVTYRPVGAVGDWTDTAAALLDTPGRAAPTREARLARAACFTWANHAAAVFGAYRRLLGKV